MDNHSDGPDAAEARETVSPGDAEPQAAKRRSTKAKVAAEQTTEDAKPYRGEGVVLVWISEAHGPHLEGDLVRADPDTADGLVKRRRARRASPDDLNGPAPIVAFEA